MTTVINMISSRGNKVLNQFIIKGYTIQMPDDTYQGDLFQSYKSNISFIAYECGNTGAIRKVFLDENYWNYSNTTSRYRNQFLNHTTKEIKDKIKSGEYILTDLNGE